MTEDRRVEVIAPENPLVPDDPIRALERKRTVAPLVPVQKWVPTESQKKFASAFKETGGQIKKSCADAGVQYQSWLRWKEDPTFRAWLTEVIEDAMRLDLLQLKMQLVQGALGGDIQQAKLVLSVFGETGSSGRKEGSRTTSFTQIVNNYKTVRKPLTKPKS